MTENEEMTAEELAAMEAEQEASEAEERARIEHENYLNSFPEDTVFFDKIVNLDGGSVRKLGSWVEDAHIAEKMGWPLDNNISKNDLTFRGHGRGIGGVYYIKGYEPAEETRDEMIARRQAEIVNIVQNIIDETAHQKRYDDGLSCVSYVGDPDEEFNADAVAFVAWRGRCWRTCYNILSSVVAGTVAPEDVTDEYVLERLPIMEWPEL